MKIWINQNAGIVLILIICALSKTVNSKILQKTFIKTAILITCLKSGKVYEYNKNK